MSNGQVTNNISLAVGLIAQLVAQAGTVAQAIQTAQAAGRDLTDEESASFMQAYNDARAQALADIAASKGTPVAGT